MGTITTRKRKDGSTTYDAQIRIMRNGVRVYQESQPFDRKTTAQAWIRKREAELYAPGGIEKANREGVTVKQMIDRYLREYEKLRPLGKTKRATLKAIGESWLGEVEDQDLNSQKLVDYAMDRIEKDGIQPQTVGNDLAHLGAVLSVARPAWGYEVDPLAMPDARRVLKKLGAVTKSVERNRRPTRDELERIIKYFQKVRDARRQEIDMVRVVVFALFSTRRQEEITRIRWDALNDQEQTALITDMKNPGQKYGNDVWCHMPDEAWRILQSMPKVADEVFPYNSRSISASFTRACHFLQIDDLHFHDLRHDGVSRLFEKGWDIPRVASVSGHRDWNSMRRYTHLRGKGDPYEGWEMLEEVVTGPVIEAPRKVKRLAAGLAP
ncbi:site-specific integrase [Pseudomonas monteilii]|uniref:site-specific integrase n=1 Tax=Pseudomonas monteilii TaxID=76759 RepID=UPI001E33050C|nr:site-specific integrase [Pseudomonas monteilii]MCE0931677.1 site-specific integrase [Pseudomonas monteilii]MCE1007507.1 site-specific integrase [Pseudomonas monteilii]WJN90163.1 site-specific integrase [Pseudomonas monteilii]WJO34775.1 site-specific integrase [Pseudomonas monteilii]WJR41120.1 site-specific integrase [Pseudomonas monteilii]